MAPASAQHPMIGTCHSDTLRVTQIPKLLQQKDTEGSRRHSWMSDKAEDNYVLRSLKIVAGRR